MHSPGIVIIGGGVIGTSIAYHLAKAGYKPTLLEASELAAGSSGACDGLVFMQSKKPGVHLELAMASLHRFSALAEELPVPIEFSQTGGLVVIETPAELTAMERFVADQQAIGLDVALLEPDQLQQKEPELSDQLLGATCSPLDAQVNPINLTLGFGIAARELGAVIKTRTTVLEIETVNSTVSGVVTDRGRFEADIVINAAGARACQVAELVDITVPIQPRRGQIVVTSPGPRSRKLLNTCLLSAKYIAAKYNPEIAAQVGQGVSMEQTASGNLLLGSTREFVGFDTSTEGDSIAGIINQTTALVPGLRRYQVIRTFAGLRPYTPDGLPLLGPVQGLDGFFMAAGHEGDGIALAPITGELMAQMVLDKQLDIDLSPFSPGRFDDCVKK